MIYIVGKKYCSKDYVQYSSLMDTNQVIVGPDGIKLLKIGDTVVINDYVSHKERGEFPNCDVIKPDVDHFIELFDYNKVYMNFSGSVNGFRLQKNYFFKSDEGALAVEDIIPVDSLKNPEITTILSREEIEAVFNPKAYQAMFVCDSNGMITFMSSKADKLTVGHNIIPSNKKLVELDYSNRHWAYMLARKLKGDYLAGGPKRRPVRRSIEDIKEMPLYGPTLEREFSHMLITLRDGQFDVEWFKIDLVEKDKFRLTMMPIFIKEPTVDDVINYRNRHEFQMRPKIVPSDSKVVIPLAEDETMKCGRTMKMKPINGKKKS